MMPHDELLRIESEDAFCGLRGLGAPSRSPEAIARREGQYQLDLHFTEVWCEISEEAFRNQFSGNPIRREFPDAASFRSPLLERVCADESDGGCFEGRLRTALGVQAIPNVSTERIRELVDELDEALQSQKEAEIDTLGLAAYRPVREELLIKQWYEIANDQGWLRSSLRKLGHHANLPVVVKEIATGRVAVCGMEHSSTNLKFGRLPMFYDVMVGGRFMGAQPQQLLRGMTAYETFRDGASAALGMRACLQLMEETLRTMPT